MNRGFTLIELLVTIALIVIVSLIAVPNFQGMIASNRAASDFNEILAGLKYARAEAIKCRGDVTFEITNGDGWSYSVTSGDCANMRDMQRSSQRGSADDATIVFGPLGQSSCPNGGCSISVGGRTIYVYSTGYMGSLDTPGPES